MALVGYSDSEGSDNEAPVASKPPTRAPKPAFQKLIDSSGPKKIKVELPTLKPEAKEEDEERPVKRARTSGLSGFNSFLPAPKRTAETKKPGLGSGVNLRTGAEPAFSREKVEPVFNQDTVEPTQDEKSNSVTPSLPVPFQEEKPAPVKMVGNAMRFKPLSVANKKQKKKPISSTPATSSAQLTAQQAPAPAPAAVLPPPKKKVSLFSVTQQEESLLPEENSREKERETHTEYQPLLTDPISESSADPPAITPYLPTPTQANTNPLDAIAADLNLSASARRQLFGRNKDSAAAAKIMHFDMEQEYASNEKLRQQGQAQEHRAVKAIAPGKHSLQQLVNAASSQKEALEDAWAEGKRNKAEGGSRYGW